MKTGTQARVLHAIKSGYMKPSEIAKRVDEDIEAVRTAITRLADRGLIDRDERGIRAATPGCLLAQLWK